MKADLFISVYSWTAYKCLVQLMIACDWSFLFLFFELLALYTKNNTKMKI